MKIHEYQAKELFRAKGIPVPPGEIATTPEEARAIAQRVGKPVMVKAQVHCGADAVRPAGVKYCANADEAF